MSRFTDVKYERLKRRYSSGIDGFAAFCHDQIKIQHPEHGLIPFELRDPQIETVTDYIQHKKNIILKARQIGFTTVTMVFSMWECLFKPYHSFINLSRREIDAIAALKITDIAWKSIDPALKAYLPKRIDDNQKMIHWDNGSFMESHPSSNNPARSRTVSRIVLDEYAFMPDPEEAWSAIEPTFDVGGSVIILSTANGIGNDYHNKWVASYVNGEGGFNSIFFPWWALPERDQDWYDQKRQEMQEWQVHQEYPSSPEEAFVKSGNPVFNVDILAKIEPRTPWRGDVDGPPDAWRGVHVTPMDHGPLSVYDWPQPYVSYAVGADVAQGLVHGDFSSAHVIRCDNLEVVAHWHGHCDADEFGLITARLAAFYNMAILGTEVNNHGLTTVKAQQRFGYPNLFARTLQTYRWGDKATSEIGFFTSAVSKPRLIDELVAVVRRREIGIWDKPTILEMIAYARMDNGSMEGQPFDDRVMSLALALMLVPFAPKPESQGEPEPEEWSMQWWSNLATEVRKPPRTPIGSFNVRQGNSGRPTVGTGPPVR